MRLRTITSAILNGAGGRISMDQQALFPTPEKGEATWHKSFEIGRGQRLEIPLYISLIEGELRDQVSLKSSVRKAAPGQSLDGFLTGTKGGLAHR